MLPRKVGRLTCLWLDDWRGLWHSLLGRPGWRHGIILLLLDVFHSLRLKLLHFFLYLALLLLHFGLLEHIAEPFDFVQLLLHFLDEFAAVWAFDCLGAAELKVVVQLWHRDHLLTELALLGFGCASVNMIIKLVFRSGEPTMLAGGGCVHLLLVLRLVRFRNAHRAGRALIILPHAAHLVHPKLARFDVFAAD